MLLVSLLAGVARSASESSPGIPTSARFVTLFQKTPDGCVGSFAIEFKKVRGATFYTFRYQMRGYGLQTNANVNTDAEMVGYKGPRPPAGSGIYVLAATTCTAKNPYAAMYGAPHAFAVRP